MGLAKFRMTRVEPPVWATQPEVRITRVTVSQYAALQQHRDKMLRVVHREVESYLNDPQLVFDGDEDGFPHRRRLTGAYYLGGESYRAYTEPAVLVIGIMCRCLATPTRGKKREGDYLGLEVWLKCVPRRWSSFEVYRSTEASSL